MLFTWLRRWLFDKGGRYVVVQMLLFLVIYLAPSKVDWVWNAFWTTFGQILGGFLLAYGGIMLGLGALHLGQNLRAEPLPTEGAKLVTNGAFSLVRHPIYSGIIFGWSGWGLFNSAEVTTILPLILLLPFFDLKTRKEEMMLISKFPEYVRYQTVVSKLIPFIY